MSIELIDKITGKKLGIDDDKQALVATNKDPYKAGAFGNYSVNAEGVYGASLRKLMSPEVSLDYRLRVEQDVCFFQDSYNYSARNTNLYLNRSAVLAAAYSGGFLTLNSGVSTATGQVVESTRNIFPTMGASELYHEVSFSKVGALSAGVALECGIGSHNATAPYAVNDGLYWRMTSDALYLVFNYNNTENAYISAFDPQTITDNQIIKIGLALHNGVGVLWINDETVSEQVVPVSNGQPLAATSSYAFFRQEHTAILQNSFQSKFANLTVSYGGANLNINYPEQAAIQGMASYRGQNGGTMGSTANYANSANPAAAVPTNTTAALGVGLGGQFWETATLALNTDGIICSYQNPTGGVGQTPRNLIIDGVRITAFIQTTMAGGAAANQLSLAYGHTAVSLATTETATTKAPTRIPLGQQMISANQAAMTELKEIDVKFSPICVFPGEFVAIAAKKIGTVFSSGVIAYNITFSGRFI